MNWNNNLYISINKLQGKNYLLDKFFYFVSQYLIYILVISTFFYSTYLWFWSDNQMFRDFVFFTVSALVLGIAASYTTAMIWPHKRPVLNIPGTKQFFRPIAMWKTFPSDHTLASFVMAESFLFFGVKSAVVLLFFIFASLIGFSRIFAGVHYPKDIIGGIIYASLACTITMLGII